MSTCSILGIQLLHSAQPLPLFGPRYLYKPWLYMDKYGTSMLCVNSLGIQMCKANPKQLLEQ